MTKTYGNFTDFIDFSRASSGTYLGSDGLLKTAADNVPRVEYDSSGVLKGLLIEEQRTNLVTYSEDFTNASWSKDATITITSNATASPSGAIDAQEVDFNTGVYLFNEYTTTSESAFTFSVYLKAPSPTTIKMNIQQSGGGVTEQTVSITTEWQRFSVTRSSTAPTFLRTTWKPDAGGEVFYAWGAQLEQGSFPTSYIPTSGATVTRSADIADIATANFGYNPKAGTLVVEAAGFLGSYPSPYSLNDGTNANRLQPYKNNSDTSVGFDVTTSTSTQANLIQTVTPLSVGLTHAASYSADNFRAAANGSLATDDTSGAIAVYTILELGTGAGTSTTLNGHIKSIKYIPRRNTNNQLQEFTS